MPCDTNVLFQYERELRENFFSKFLMFHHHAHRISCMEVFEADVATKKQLLRDSVFENF